VIKIVIATPFLDPIHPLVKKSITDCMKDSEDRFKFHFLEIKGSDLAGQRETMVKIALQNNCDAIFHLDGDQPYDGRLSSLLRYLWDTGKTVIGCAYPWQSPENPDHYVAGNFCHEIPDKLISKKNNGIIQVGWCGHGALFVRCEYYRKYEQIIGDRLYYDPEWYIDNDGKRHRLSESLSFGKKCKRLNIDVYLDCDHIFRHEKL
jgi:hypothetical protein